MKLPLRSAVLQAQSNEAAHLGEVAPLETVAPPLSSAWWVARLATKAGFEIRSAAG